MIMKDIKLLYIDLFCGAGGTSTGIEYARYDGIKCAKVVACVNHDANAIASHAANHPEVLHFTEDIRTLELSPLISHIEKMKVVYPEALIVLWGSMECTNFSKAKGGRPRDADSRTLAEHLYRYIEAINPDYIQIENVEEFMCWGKLDENGKPVSRDKGTKYVQWANHIQSYGYNYDYRILNAADFGAYTSRKRYFGIFAKNGIPIAFPSPTHGKNPKKTDRQPSLFPQQPPLKKWKPVKDVLDFSDEGESIFTRKKPLSDKTLERIYAGLIKFVAGGKDNFLSAYYGTSKNFNRRFEHSALSVEKPCGVVTTANRFGIVQTVFLSKYYSGHPESKNKSIDDPADAITTKDHHSLVYAEFLSAYYGNGHNHSVEVPAPVVRTKDTLAKVSLKFIQQRNTGHPSSKVFSVEQPARTITSTGGNMEVVTARFLDMQYGKGKPADCNLPAPTLTACPKHNVVSCHWIMNTNFSNIGSAITEPAQTITANRKWFYLMNPQFNSSGGSIDDPCFTLIARMDKMPPYLVTTENGQLAIEVYESDTEPLRRIKLFMAIYGIADIKMRMLKILELIRIMGFPENYTLIGTQAEQKKYLGNAVEVNMARVLCEALVAKLYEVGLIKRRA